MEIDRQLTVKSDGRIRRLFVPRIRFIESAGRKVIVHTEHEDICYYDRMSDLEEALTGEFFRIHRAYLVNLRYVSGYSTGEVEVEGGERLLLSKYKKSAFLAAYRDFLRGQAA